MNSAHSYSEGAEVPEDKTKDRIEKEAITYVIRETGYQVLPEHDHWKKAYIAAATAERNKAIDECMNLVEMYVDQETWDKLESLKTRS